MQAAIGGPEDRDCLQPQVTARRGEPGDREMRMQMNLVEAMLFRHEMQMLFFRVDFDAV